ncbi:MAG: methylmalonyl Co-A mutase-associated GTPase MeaB [Candidatus Cloacimonadota bacterium]|nr:MAG: methylmalonyl Co-A mutase-associated GTPase MeaB [Candidatus Cloacimonadota bacterium]
MVKALLERFFSGNKVVLAKLITIIENDDPQADEVIHTIYPKMKNCCRIGFTGPPGVGKSTLLEKVIMQLRKNEKTVAAVSVDPTSPFTGGAILGDRIRMTKVYLDEGVFIRSMASRGSLGGIAHKTKSVCDLIDAFGFDYIFIETVGVGQIEIDIMDASHITVVILAPESGDGIQTLKAGLMEIGDIFVVNKGDRDGADNLVNLIRYSMELKQEKTGRQPKVIKTIATGVEGVNELVDTITATCREFEQRGTFDSQKETWARKEIQRLIEREVMEVFWKDSKKRVLLDNCVKDVIKGKLTPFEAQKILLAKKE